MFSIVNSKGIKLGILAFMLLCFLIPLSFVESILYERQQRSNEAILEISSKWGEQKVIAGPFLVIPYQVQKKRFIDDAGKKFVIDTIDKEALILPDELLINSNVITNIRSRGIYDAVLYQADIDMSGKFPDASKVLAIQNAYKVFWDQAFLSIYTSDNKGLLEELKISWNKQDLPFHPGSGSQALQSGIHTIDKINVFRTNNFELALKMNGSQSLAFVPIGKSTKTQIMSNWADPSFFGSDLPLERSISEQGFSATWNSSYFSRNYSQVLLDSYEFTEKNILNSNYGVNFFIPLDHYRLIERSLKYAILILLSCFTVFFLIETLNALKLHPIQYLLMGAAMVIFYVLNLSLSEHIGFILAYMISSLAISSLIGYYSGFILKSKAKGIQCFFYFCILFGFLYVILSAQDYALLLGSIAIFALLAFVMHATRKLDWSKSEIKQAID